MAYLNAARLAGREWDEDTTDAITALQAAQATSDALGDLVAHARYLTARRRRALATVHGAATEYAPALRHHADLDRLNDLAAVVADDLAGIVKRMCLESGGADAALYIADAEK